MNSDIILFDSTVKHSLGMSSTTLGDKIRYFMFKYGIYMSEWYGPLRVLYGKTIIIIIINIRVQWTVHKIGCII